VWHHLFIALALSVTVPSKRSLSDFKEVHRANLPFLSLFSVWLSRRKDIMVTGIEMTSEEYSGNPPLSFAALYHSIDQGDFSMVSAVSKLSLEEGRGLLEQFPFVVSSLVGGGYYKEANIFLADQSIGFGLPSESVTESGESSDLLVRLDPISLRAQCEREFLSTMMTGDVSGSLQRLKKLRLAAEDPLSRAFAQELLARALLCGYATGFLAKGMAHEMRIASEESVELWRLAGDPAREVKALIRLAEHYQRQGELFVADLVFGEAFRRLEGAIDTLPHFRALHIELSYRLCEAQVLRRGSDRNAAAIGRFFDDVGALLADALLGDLSLAATFILESLSRVASSLGRDATPFFLELAKLAERTHNRTSSFQAHQGLGTLYFSRGELRRAQSEFEQARSIGSISGMPIMHSTAILGLLQVAVHQGRFDDAVSLATDVEHLSHEFPITRTALGLSVASILAQIGLFDKARESCANLLEAVRAQEDMRLMGQILFFRGHLNSVERNWSAAMRDWRAAKKAQERVHDVAAQVTTLRALSQGALMEQTDSRSRNSANAKTTEAGEQGEGRSVTAEQRALNFLSEAEALLISRAASTQPVEHNLQLGGVCLAKAQILVRAGDQTSALKMLGQARKAYVEAESGCDVAISDSLNGLVLLELAAKGHPMLFPEAVSSFERAASFFERHQIAQLLWKVRFYQSRSYFQWGGAESLHKAKIARWKQADFTLHQAADLLDRLKGFEQPQIATALDSAGTSIDPKAVYEFGIELNAQYLRDEEGVERWKSRAR
jgi:tetratricopeptide (TPR) repeat protein